MALGQKARWAKLKGESKSPAPTAPEPEKPKRNLSAAAKAKLVANLKKARAAKAAKAKAAAKKWHLPGRKPLRRSGGPNGSGEGGEESCAGQKSGGNEGGCEKDGPGCCTDGGNCRSVGVQGKGHNAGANPLHEYRYNRI